MTKLEQAIEYCKTCSCLPSAREISEIVGCSRRHARRIRSAIRSEVTSESKINHKAPKVLILDIETSPMEVLVWGLYKQRPSDANVLKEWSILSWACKWLFDDEIMSRSVTAKEAIDREDGNIIRALWDIIDEADIVIAHNAVNFDIRKINARFVLNRLPPPMPYQVIDTLKVSQRNFAFSTHKLDYINKLLDFERKIKTNYGLWKRCIRGDSSALKEMETYNRGDVVALEEFYVYLRPWVKSHPNMGLYVDTVKDDGTFITVCPTCGSEILKHQWKGFYYTPAGKYRTFRCVCGSIGRSRYSSIGKGARKVLSVSVAR